MAGWFSSLFRKYSTAVNRLQQRTIDVFYRILIDEHEQYNWSTRYGALIGLCEMGNNVEISSLISRTVEHSFQVIIQIVFPLLERLGEHLRLLLDKEIAQQLNETVVVSSTKRFVPKTLVVFLQKFITIAYRSVRTDYDTNEKKLQEDFGCYFAPLIQHQLILLL